MLECTLLNRKVGSVETIGRICLERGVVHKGLLMIFLLLLLVLNHGIVLLCFMLVFEGLILLEILRWPILGRLVSNLGCEWILSPGIERLSDGEL